MPPAVSIAAAVAGIDVVAVGDTPAEVVDRATRCCGVRGEDAVGHRQHGAGVDKDRAASALRIFGEGAVGQRRGAGVNSDRAALRRRVCGEGAVGHHQRAVAPDRAAGGGASIGKVQVGN